MKLDIKRLLPIQRKLNEFLDNVPNIPLMKTTINAMLVWGGALGAFYKESLDRKSEDMFQSVLNLMNSTEFTPKIQEGPLEFVYVDPEIIKHVDSPKMLDWLGGYQPSRPGNDEVFIHINANAITIQRLIIEVDMTRWASERKKIQHFLVKKAENYNKILRLFNMSMNYDIEFNLSEETKIEMLSNDSFVDEHYDDYVSDIWNSWTQYTLFNNNKNTDTWEDVKAGGLTELFRFIYSVIKPVHSFRGILEEIEQKSAPFTPNIIGPKEEYKSKPDYEGQTRRINKFEKEVAQFELELSQSGLLGMPYKTWRNSLEYRTIVNRQPDRLRKAMDRRWRLFGV
jgi:hypothetical protein